MNDFSKEELDEILFFIELHKNKYRLKYPEALLNKLQSMIDNYCEHESNGYWSQLADCSYHSLRCSKCRKEFGRQKFNNELEKFVDE